MDDIYMGEPKKSLFDVMEKMTGISKEEQKRIFEEVQENRKQLEECELHDFSEEYIPPGRSKLNPEWRCTNCGGHVDFNAKKFYEQGFAHAMNLKEKE